MSILSPKATREVSVTIIRSNVEKAELMLRTLQKTIGAQKITCIGKLGAKIKFDEKDNGTSSKVVEMVKGCNIDDEDRIVLVTRKEGIVESSTACNTTQLESFLLA